MSADEKRFFRGLEVIEEIKGEIDEATSKYPPFRSFHEGWAIIKEELDELWEEIRKKPSKRDRELIRKEAIQVAAMAARFAIDLSEYDQN